MLEVGTKAPEFTLPNKDNEQISLSSFRGKKVILYFYPKDNTPGCTKQALKFKENFEKLDKQNVVVIGISKDSPASHEKFVTKYELPFVLLSDESTNVLQQYQVWGLKKFMGREFMGTIRSTYMIDEEGIIRGAFEKVKPDLDPESYL